MHSDLRPFRAFWDDSVPKQPTLKLKSEMLAPNQKSIDFIQSPTIRCNLIKSNTFYSKSKLDLAFIKKQDVQRIRQIEVSNTVILMFNMFKQLNLHHTVLSMQGWRAMALPPLPKNDKIIQIQVSGC